ncbi:MAG: hypothetical protein ACLURV_12355 [Gallintestinimicrobium sp.]
MKSCFCIPSRRNGTDWNREQTADGYTAAVEQDRDVWLALDYIKQYSV